HLNGRDRMGRMGTANTLGPCLAHPEITDLALLDEPGHRADGLFDRHRRIDAMLIVEIDGLDTEPLQARLASLRDIGRAAVDAIGAAGPPRLAEFAGNHDAVAPPLERPPKQILVLAPTIHVRAVEMIDAEIDRPMDQRDPCRLV